MMRHLANTVATGALMVVAALSAGAARPEARSEPAPPAPERAADLVEAFERRVEAHRDALKIPGLSFVVLKDGEVISARGFGYADVERRIPATPDTLYHIASLTKTFTAILIMRLVERGQLDLDEPVSRYSDEFKDDSVRIKHLLSHTSEGTPGEKFSYNPQRFEYLKAVLEKKVGVPLRQQFVETFLDPLGMRDSVPGPDVADDDTTWAVLGAANLARYRKTLQSFARPYTYWGKGETVYAGYPPRDFWASAGLLSTVNDLAKYDMAVDSHKLLKAETLARAWTPFLSNAGQPLAHGLGWYVTDYRGTRLVWHYGHWGTGFSALYVKVPAQRLTFIALSNSEALADHQFKVGQDVTNNLFACSFLNVFEPAVANRAGTKGSRGVPSSGPANDCERSSREALERWLDDRRAGARKEIALDPKLAAAYAGRYQLPRRVLTVTEEGGRLYIDVPKGDRSELFAETSSKFFLKIRPWTFTFVKEGSKVIRLELLDGGETVIGQRVD